MRYGSWSKAPIWLSDGVTCPSTPPPKGPADCRQVLFLAIKKLRARVVEMPVTTTYRPESTFNIRRHLPLFLRDIVEIRLNDLKGSYEATATMAR
jgi:hypothetical protein